LPASTAPGIHSARRAGGLRSTARAHHPRAGLGRHGAAAGSGAGVVLGVICELAGRAPARPAAVNLAPNTSKSQAQKKSLEALFLFSGTAGLPEDNLERETRLELATPTLARLCSTN